MQLAYQWWENISREASNQPPLYKRKAQQLPVQLSYSKLRHRWLALRVDRQRQRLQVKVKSGTTNQKNKSSNQAFPNRASTVSVVSTNSFYFWLQLSGYRKCFEAASMLCCGLEQSCGYLGSPGAGGKKAHGKTTSAIMTNVQEKQTKQRL